MAFSVYVVQLYIYESVLNVKLYVPVIIRRRWSGVGGIQALSVRRQNNCCVDSGRGIVSNKSHMASLVESAVSGKTMQEARSCVLNVSV